MNTGAEKYVKKYDDLLNQLAAAVVDAALEDEAACVFLAESVHVIFQKASMILNEEHRQGGHC